MILSYKESIENNCYDFPLFLKIRDLISLSSKPNYEIHHSQHRKERWEVLNSLIIQKEKNDKGLGKLNGHLPFSSLKMKDVGEAFPLHKYVENIKVIPEIMLLSLQNDLTKIIRCYKINGKKTISSELSVNLFINTILVFVVDMFEGEINIVSEDYMIGRKVFSRGSFEFVLMIGSNRVLIVEAKKGLVAEGLAQNLAGCEVAAEIDKSDIIYGITSTFRDWTFLKNTNDIIYIDATTDIVLDHGDNIQMKGLTNVTGKLYSILFDLIRHEQNLVT